jgi:GDP-L-fucose synthase
MLKGAKVLVTGGAGFIGANLIERLLKERCQVRATLHSHPPVIQNDSIEYIQTDLTRPEACRKAVREQDFVFMAAAQTSGAAVMAKTPLAHVTPNVLMNTLLLEAAHQAGVKKVLFISSSAAYPPTGERPVKEDEMFDADPYPAYYSVGWMKRYAEILCKIYAEEVDPPMATVVVRPSNIYGPYDKFDPETSHVTSALIRRVAQKQNPLSIWGTGEDVRDLIYIDDFLEGMLLAFQKTDNYLAVNIASGEGVSVKEVLQMLLKLDGQSNSQVQFDASKPQMIPVRLVDPQLAKQKLGFQSQISLEDGLRQTLAWYREHQAAWSR